MVTAAHLIHWSMKGGAVIATRKNLPDERATDETGRYLGRGFVNLLIVCAQRFVAVPKTQRIRKTNARSMHAL